ncbi:MAG: zinc ribbon domain-containing protein [Candidatus Neomarinimicrobiota bacterium]|nr:MAG: zinc ribbon domain-containing protein [Candidatus Neomarinimicrobiota bacterium]
MMAENFTLIEPDDEPDEFPDQHGITFYRFHYDALAAGQEQSLEVRYDNPTGQHTMDVLTSMMNSGGSGAAAGANTSTLSASTVPDRFRLAIWQPLAALLVMALIVGLTYPRFGSVPPKQVASVNRNTASGGKATARTPKFCSQCGSPVQPRDKFCSHCGHKL